jgi:predicted dehydrogenase
MRRREFLQIGSAATLAIPVLRSGGTLASATTEKPVRLGVVGVGGRGTHLLSLLLAMGGVEVPAICDINDEHLARAQGMVEKASQKRPEGYSRDEEDFQRLMFRDDLDAVLIATYWEWHTPMAVCAMKAGKYAATEVPAAITLEECWELVNTSEETGVPCMMLENWSFRRYNLAVLNMIRQGLLGEIVHCHCAYFDDGVKGAFFDDEGNMLWRGKYLVNRNADQYPTHGLGPVISWMDIGCGDYFAYLTSTASRSLGVNHYFAKKFGPNHPNAKRQYAQGDIVTSVVRTQKGKTIVINNDMELPRPYDNRWLVQGTEGVYDESRNAIYLEGRSPKDEEWEPFDPYVEKYEHTWWKAPGQRAAAARPEEIPYLLGADTLELNMFLKAVRNKTPAPIDVYDSVIMSVIIPLSEKSIASGSAPVECPDFTRGKWKTKKATFGIET